MKKHINRHSILLALAASAALALTACSDTAPPASAAPVAPAADPTPAAETQPAGTVLLSVNPEIEMDYDAAGSVLTLEGKNDDALAVLSGYTGYEGRACADVVGELVGRIHQGGYFDDTISGHERNIVLKLEQGSAQPGEAFLEELAAAAQSASASGQIGSRAVTLDEDDYDDAYGDKGYISAEAAREVLSAQLQRDDLQFVEREYDLSDGEYELEFVLDGVEYEYEVNAVTGKVTEAERDGADDDDRDDLYDDDWDDDRDDLYDDDWDDDRDDLYDDDWDDGQDDLYDDDWDDGRDDLYDDDWDDGQDDLYDDDWDDGQDDLYDDDWDDGQDDLYDDWDDGQDDLYDDDWDDDRDDLYDDDSDDDWDDLDDDWDDDNDDDDWDDDNDDDDWDDDNDDGDDDDDDWDD